MIKDIQNVDCETCNRITIGIYSYEQKCWICNGCGGPIDDLPSWDEG